MAARPVTAIAPWFGSNRTLAENVGAALAGCTWVGVPFGGGMCEVARLAARSVVVGDLHAHVLNLAAVVADAAGNAALRARLAALPVHPDVLAAAQARCRARESGWYDGEVPPVDVDAAVDYFVCAWMARNGMAGTAAEFRTGLSVRWDSGGGDSATRFRHATEALADWQETMQRCTFVKLDVFAFLARAKDRPDHGLYCDPPFPDVGDGYKHAFSEDQHRQLAVALTAFRHARVVCRFYRHPLVERLYPASAWGWAEFAGRRASNRNDAPEVLVANNPKED